LAKKALSAFLAKAWSAPKAKIELLAVSKDQNTVLRLSGQTNALLANL